MTAGQHAHYVSYATSIRKWLYREAYHLCRDWFEADDLVQVTLLKMYRQWDQLQHHDHLLGYTRQALLRTYLSERRRSRWRREVIQREPPGRWEAAVSVEDRLVLLEAMRRLGPRQRAVVTLRFWQDLSVEQTAAVLGCSPGTVTSQTHRALSTLRYVLTD